MEGSLEKVKRILSDGYPIDLPLNDEAKTTAAHLAANLGKIEILRYLIEQDAELNLRDSKGWTPLILAALGGEVDCVTALLKSDRVDVLAADKNGQNALKFAEARLVDDRVMGRSEKGERYEKVIAALKKQMQVIGTAEN